MNNKFINVLLVIIPLLMIFITPAFGRSMITGKVVDAVTGEPIEGAAIYIEWSKMGSGPPGLAGQEIVEVFECLSDANGNFEIPKYSTWLKKYVMAIYKETYVCWSSEKVFPSWEDRKNSKLKNNLLIKLEPFKKEYSKEEHARFTVFMAIGCRGVFDKAIKKEREIKGSSIQKLRDK